MLKLGIETVKPITICLEPSLINDLKKFAGKKSMSVSQAVRYFLDTEFLRVALEEVERERG